MSLHTERDRVRRWTAAALGLDEQDDLTRGDESALEDVRERVRAWAEDRGEHPAEPEIRATLGGVAGPAVGGRVARHLLACEECRLDAVTLPETTAGGVRVDRLTSRSLRLVASLACAAILGAAAYRLVWRTGPATELPAPAISLTLRASRDDAARPSVSFATLPAAGLALTVDARLERGAGRWRIAGEDGSTLAEGFLALPPEGPRVRSIAIVLPRSSLRPGAFALEIRSAESESEGRWPFAIEP